MASEEDPYVTTSSHPVVLHKLSILRNKDLSPKTVRDLIRELSYSVILDASKDLTLEEYDMETPLVKAKGYRLKESIALVPILRAGLGMVDSVLDIFPNASVYHIGMYRDQRSLLPVEYYNKLPNDREFDICFVLDPMLATGGTARATIGILKEWGAKRIRVIGILASQAAVSHLRSVYPDVSIHVCAIDKELDKNGYIIPGLGDAGDRQFATF